MPLRFFAISRTLYSLENTPLKTSTEIIFDLLYWHEIATLSLPKKSCHHLFAGIFASEPMKWPEIDHVSFFAEYALYIFRR